MTALPSFAFPDMDASHLDDKMDVASSPFRQADDIDIDLDSVRDPSEIGSVHDEMVDDPAAPADAASDVMQDQYYDILADDDMFDDTRQDLPEHNDTDYNMDGSIEEVQVEDEDILYEEEEETGPAPLHNDGTVEYNDHQDDGPPEYHEVAAEVIPDDLDHQPEPQEEDSLATNQSENLPASDNTITGNQLADNLEPGQALDVSGQYLEEPREAQGHQEEQQDDGPVQESEHAERTDHQDSLDDLPEAQTPTEAPNSLVPTNAESPKEQQEEGAVTSSEADNVAKAVHPVTLYYLEEEMSLFPPMLGDASSVYFLSDSSLAFGPLDKLLAACREILVGTLDHHDELVLDVPGLGLHICEDSKYATQITLAQILDVYLHLCHNDEGQEARPLYCHLSSRVSLASQYAYLASAGGDGKTYAEIAADHLDSPELENEDGGEHQEQQDDNRPLADGEPTGTEEQPNRQLPVDHPEDGKTPDALDLEDQTQNDDNVESAAEQGSTQVTGTTEDVPAPHADQPDNPADTQASEQLNLHAENYAQEDDQDYEYDEVQVPENASDELDQGLRVADHSDVNHEDDTNSSHTVEGDWADASGQNHEQPDDVFQPPDVEVPQPRFDNEPYADEELFTTQDEYGQGHEQDVFADIPGEDLSPTLQATTEQDLTQDATSFERNDELAGQERLQPASATAIPIPGNLSPPATPKQGKQAKRKAEDDDELLFLDLDTPDPKRRRPS